MRLLSLAFVLLTFLGGMLPAPARAQTAVCNDGKSIKFAGQTWESAEFTTNILRQILEKAYGCKTETVPGTPAATETALTQNDLQVIAAQWSGRSKIVADAMEAGQVRVVGYTLQSRAQQGLVVPAHVVPGCTPRGLHTVAHARTTAGRRTSM